jgi:hypothetical protein
MILRNVAIGALAIVLTSASSQAQTLTNMGSFGSRRPELPVASIRAAASRDMARRVGARQSRQAIAPQAPAAAAQQELSEWQAAADAAEADPRHFSELLRAHLRSPDRDLPETELGTAVRIAGIAADTFAFNEYISAFPVAERAKFDDARDRLSTLVATATTEPPKNEVMVVADGNFRGETSGGGEGAPVGTGSLALQAMMPSGLWKASIAIASTQDTITDGFGTALLAPASGKALTSGLLDVHLAAFPTPGIPLHLYASVAREQWQVQDTPSVRAAGVTVLGLGALFYRQVASATVQNTDLSLVLEAGGAARFLGGNILSEADSVRLRVLSTRRTAFIGPEVGLQLSVGKMSGALQLYYMPRRNDEHVPNFSGLQLVAGIGVTGELFGGLGR